MIRQRRTTTRITTAARGRARAVARPLTKWGEASREVLPNGLRVLTVPAPGLHSAMIALYVRLTVRWHWSLRLLRAGVDELRDRSAGGGGGHGAVAEPDDR